MADQPPNAATRVKHFLARVFGLKEPDFYRGKDYLDGYAAHTDWRVARDPQEAVGGMWEEIGSLQFDFLRAQGLATHHRMLDFGCGTLRGGRHFIGYLDASNYWGIDISPACLKAARELIAAEGLESKNPTLILNEARGLEFREFGDTKFDYILAQSVFTHLPDDSIRECFKNVGNVMADGAKFFFTYWRNERYQQFGPKDFAYPWTYFLELADEYGVVIRDLSGDYPHPRNQQMGCITRE